jgi:hypothetical protein
MKTLILITTSLLISWVTAKAQVHDPKSNVVFALHNSHYETRYIRKANGSVFAVKLFNNNGKIFYIRCQSKMDVSQMELVKDDDTLLDPCLCGQNPHDKWKNGPIRVQVNDIQLKDFFPSVTYMQKPNTSPNTILVIPNSSLGEITINKKDFYKAFRATPVNKKDTIINLRGFDTSIPGVSNMASVTADPMKIKFIPVSTTVTL